VPIDRKQLPKSADVLQQMVFDLIARLDAEHARRIKRENLLRQLLAARSGRRSEQITEEQLALFEAELKAQGVKVEALSKGNAHATVPTTKTRLRRQAAQKPTRVAAAHCPGHLKRERAVHHLAEAEKQCDLCGEDLHEFGEETSRRCLQKVLVRLHGKDGSQAFAAHREKHGGRESRGEIWRSSSAAPAGKNLPAFRRGTE
jgi:hypothetical protein